MNKKQYYERPKQVGYNHLIGAPDRGAHEDKKRVEITIRIATGVKTSLKTYNP